MQLTDLEWNTDFTSTILLHDSIVPNSYNITIKFNSNTDNLEQFIKNKGYIVHLTTFNGKWDDKNLNHILKFKNKIGI